MALCVLGRRLNDTGCDEVVAVSLGVRVLVKCGQGQSGSKVDELSGLVATDVVMRKAQKAALEEAIEVRLHPLRFVQNRPPHNGSRISGEPLLKSFHESKGAGASRHELPYPEREARRIEGGEAQDGLRQGSSVCIRLLCGPSPGYAGRHL